MSSLLFVLKSFSLVVLLFGLLTQAAPAFEKRQIGNLQCNIDRVKIVASLAQLKGTVNGLATDVASDPAASAAVKTAQGGITDADNGIKTIATALFTGQQAPADARDQVEAGLNAVNGALGNLTLSDAGAQAKLDKAKTQLQAAGDAGNGVLANCK